MRYVAVKFENETDLLKAMHALDEVDDVPLTYDVVKGSSILVLPAHLGRTALSIIEKLGLNVERVPTKPFGQLKPEQQWQLRRGRLANKRSA